MRHRKAGIKLNRTSSHRNAMFRNMVTSLFEHGKIRTTDAKAKELRRWADHLVTLAKQGNLHARRQALAIMRNKNLVHKLFEDAEMRFGTIQGGYTRITKIGPRKGDAAPVSLVELIGGEKDSSTGKTQRRSFFGFGKKPEKAAPAKEAPKAEAEETEEVETSPAEAEPEARAAEPETVEPEEIEPEPAPAEPEAEEEKKTE